MTPKRLHPMVELVWIRALEASGGSLSPIEAFSWLRALEDIAISIKTPPVVERAADLNGPIHLPGVILYPPCLKALELLGRIFTIETRQTQYVVAFIIAHGQDPEFLDRIQSYPDREILKATREWKRSVKASWDAVRLVCNELLQRLRKEPGESRGDDDSPADCGPVISALCREYPGMKPEDFIFGSAEQMIQRIRDMDLRQEREREAYANANGTSLAPSASSWRSKQQIKFNRLSKSFVNWAAEQGAKNEQ
jgi:hypothetical protein